MTFDFAFKQNQMGFKNYKWEEFERGNIAGEICRENFANPKMDPLIYKR